MSGLCESKSLEDREIGRRFATLEKFCPQKLRELFPEGDDTGTFIVPALDVLSQILSIKDRRKGVGKPVFKLASFGNGQLFDLATPGLCVPGILDDAMHLAQPFTVPDCTLRVSWKAQLRVSLPPRALMTVSHTTCGIP